MDTGRERDLRHDRAHVHRRPPRDVPVARSRRDAADAEREKAAARTAGSYRVNAVVPDTAKWEQSAAYRLDRHPGVHSFVKNAGLGFAIPYLHNGEHHDYLPDFIVRLAGAEERCYLILETKGYDPLEKVKTQAAERWGRAGNAGGGFGVWCYAVVSDMGKVGEVVRRAQYPHGDEISRLA